MAFASFLASVASTTYGSDLLFLFKAIYSKKFLFYFSLFYMFIYLLWERDRVWVGEG